MDRKTGGTVKRENRAAAGKTGGTDARTARSNGGRETGTGNLFPERYGQNIRTLREKLSVDEETAMAMILMTAALMDLYPEDGAVVEMILRDCGAESTDGAYA